MNILEEQKIFLHQEQEKIWAMDGKQEEVEEKISIGLFLNVLAPGKINKIQIDTHHFKGNYPDKCSLQAAYLNNKISDSKAIVEQIKKVEIIIK